MMQPIYNNSSLKSFGINYKQIDLVDSDFAYDKIVSFLNIKVKKMLLFLGVFLLQNRKTYQSILLVYSILLNMRVI